MDELKLQAQGWAAAANWIRNNYQAHPTVAGLCDAMLATAPPAPVVQQAPAAPSVTPMTAKDHRDWINVAMSHTDAPAPVQQAAPSEHGIDYIMEAVQCFASEWSLVGGRFDRGEMLEQAQATKERIRVMVSTAPVQQAPAAPSYINNLRFAAVPAPVQQAAPSEPVELPHAFFYYRANEDGSVAWGEDCVCIDDVFSGEEYEFEATHHGGKVYSEAQVRALLAAAPAQPVIQVQQAAPSGWQPIETAPKNGQYILLGSEDAGGAWVGHYCPVYTSGYRPENPWASMMLNCDHLRKNRNSNRPTHWMPLPPAPAAAPAQPVGLSEQDSIDTEEFHKLLADFMRAFNLDHGFSLKEARRALVAHIDAAKIGEQDKLDAARYCVLRDVPNDRLGHAGVPCIAVPESAHSGNFMNDVDADQVVDAAIAAKAGAA